MITLSKCPVCNKSELSIFLSTKDYFLTNEDFDIVKCNSCGFKFTNPRPNESDIGKYYESSEYISHSNVKQGFVNQLYQLIRKITINRKIGIINQYFKKGSILDIGCGTGEFLNSLKLQNYDTIGIEPNEIARKHAIEKYDLEVLDEEGLDKLEKDKFDVITLWHVLEHVFHLDERINQIKQLLSKDGILIVALPNSNSWDAKHYKQYWAAFDCPRHLYHFDQVSVKNLFLEFGFELIKSTPMIFDAFYICMLSEKYKTGKSNMIKAFFYGLKSNLSAMFNQNNYSSIIYILKTNNS
ncbi:MAG: class I SAM-dependent methyltransferase [Bacteroidales bacterium]|nr:class I SAM-dependent methyltransferase [Bacteroidales bacterium]